ncbi:MAG: HAD family hydrolase [Gammaproteobacteria bacterium]|nr:glycosyltransferase [Pseudomonadales bacterium]MCP5349335.1 glycosyltransferase [Pseudomonadales bacterium]
MTPEQPQKLYIALISVHGLIRGENLELGRDADTGGQTKYVVELARALGELDEVGQVDLITRRIVDPSVSEDYARRVEPLNERARIVRIDAGPESYIAKENLWDYIENFADNVLDWFHQQADIPDLIHSHYADAGQVGVQLSHITGIPLIHTGHSLGRDKRRRLLATGLSLDEIDQVYNMSRRIEAEEEVLANADLVITSTRNEIEDQYEIYDYYDPDSMAVIPPGIDLEKFHAPVLGEPKPPVARDIRRFLDEPDKPIILALSRPDARKNISTLLESFGESRRLQELANLVIIAGNREDIRDMEAGAQAVLTDLLVEVDFYDIYGRIAIPKQHASDEVPAIYRLVASSGGVFVNPALTEPFGLTLLEASASGIPVVATENGGPVDIISNCHNGILVDPLDKQAMTDALISLLTDNASWRELSTAGLTNIPRFYSWAAHASTYLELAVPLIGQTPLLPKKPKTRRPMQEHNRAIFTDIDQNLLGDPAALSEFRELLKQHRNTTTFGITTARRLDSALTALKQYEIPMPDILITSLGTEIYYAPKLTPSVNWQNHIDHSWNRRQLVRLLENLPGLVLQDAAEQSDFKISFHYRPDQPNTPSIQEIQTLLRKEEQTVNVIHSFGEFVDIVPGRASKGLALRYISSLWDIPLNHILVAGGSGADEDLMRGNTLAVVVANRQEEELSDLIDMDRIYFASRPFAGGILEAVDHYRFLDV